MCSCDTGWCQPPLPVDDCSVIPATEDGSYCLIDWKNKIITINCGLASISYPFTKCKLQSVWYESTLDKNILRRGVLIARGFQNLSLTLAPQTHLTDEVALSRLGAELIDPKMKTENGLIQRVNLGPLTTGFYSGCLEKNGILKKIKNQNDSQIIRESDKSWRNIETVVTENDDGEPWIELGGEDESAIEIEELKEKKERKKTKEKKERKKMKKEELIDNPSIDKVRRFQRLFSSNMEKNLVKPLISLTQFFLDLFGNSEGRRKFANSSDRIFSNLISLDEETIFPVQLFLFRHGQQSLNIGDSIEQDSGLSELGRIQTIKTSELLHEWTLGFKGIMIMLSSKLKRSKESRNIVWLAAKKLGCSNSEAHRLSNCHLNERLPNYQYELEETENEDKKKEMIKEINQNGKSLDKSYWVLSSTLRGLSGPLTRRVMQHQPQVVCHESNQFHECHPYTSLRFRFPPLFISTESSLLDHGLSGTRGSFSRAPTVMYSGHGNVIKNFIIREIGFPNLFWRNVQIPNGACIVMGLHQTGRPSIIIADAGYLMKSIPVTFTPFIKDDKQLNKEISFKSKLFSDTVDVLPASDASTEKVFGGVAGLMKYSRPTESVLMKNVLLLRAGHNKIMNGVDCGLTEIGKQQIECAGDWLTQFFISNRLVDKPSAWCAAGLMSQFSSIDLTLKQSLLIIQEKFKEIFDPDTHNLNLFPNTESLYPENIFAPPTSSVEGSLSILLADDYHLLKYFATCFGINASILRDAYWPHAGFILITITETGWPELRTFGTISHMHPYQISILPQVMDKSQINGKTGNHRTTAEPKREISLRKSDEEIGTLRSPEDIDDEIGTLKDIDGEIGTSKDIGGEIGTSNDIDGEIGTPNDIDGEIGISKDINGEIGTLRNLEDIEGEIGTPKDVDREIGTLKDTDGEIGTSNDIDGEIGTVNGIDGEIGTLRSLKKNDEEDTAKLEMKMEDFI